MHDIRYDEVHDEILVPVPYGQAILTFRGVADGQHDRDVTLGGFGERLVTPGPPVHRVARVLEQVRAGRILEPVHPSTVVTSAQVWDAVKLSNSAAAVEGESEIDSTYRPM